MLNFPTVQYLVGLMPPTPIEKMRVVARDFIETTVNDGVIEAARGGLRFKRFYLPMAAYKSIDDFETVCKEMLHPMGYKINVSYPNNGIASAGTLDIIW